MAELPQLLLAAGGSSRMGIPKALLPWAGQTLIEHQVQTLLKTGQPVAAVLGSQAREIQPVLEKYPVMVLTNKRWKEGMGSSIAYGTSRIIAFFPEAAGILVSLVDQPLLTPHHFENLFRAFEAGSKQIIASISDSGWQGVPALFDQFYFESLQSLQGDEGAKQIIRQHPLAVQYIKCVDPLDDMDTPESYQRLLGLYLGLH